MTVFFWLSTWRSVPKIIAIKVESCKYYAEFRTFFSPCQILGGEPSENCTRVITPALSHVDWKKFHDDTPTRPGVIVAHTLNFSPNFKFSRLKFFWGTPVPVGLCAKLLWSISRTGSRSSCSCCNEIFGSTWLWVRSLKVGLLKCIQFHQSWYFASRCGLWFTRVV